LSAGEREKIKQEIKLLEEDIEEKRKLARKRRRTTASIREQFLLDAEQNKIKRSKLFNGPLIINGGPGTGKTTLLIHRIQYMLDTEIEYDEMLTMKLTAEEKDFIRNQKTGWIFFSPTTLLKKYLENAMASEGLEAHDETVRTWEQQRASLKTAMGLFNAETGRPFQSYRSEESLWILSVKQVKELLASYDEYIKDYFLQKLKNVQGVELKGLSWEKEGKEINNLLKFGKDGFKLESFILRLNELARQYESLRLDLEKTYRDLMDDAAARVQQRLTTADKDWFKAILQERKKKKAEVSDEIEEVETEELVNAFDDEEVIEGKRLEVDINKLIKRVVRTDALSQLDASTRLSKGDKEILDKIGTYINKEKYADIGARSLFIKYYKPFLKGSDAYILSQFARIYKSFRKEVVVNLDWLPLHVRVMLNKIIESNPKNTRIHEDELDFLILLALRLSRVFYTASPAIFRDSGQPILAAYKIYMKGIVAVDEATDFTPVQLACMYNLSRPRLNALTLSGDLMQQMDSRGIDNWFDLEALLPGVQIKSLYKSYRQTPKLLELATRLFENRYGEHPGFEAAEQRDENDPDPLLYIQDDFDAKINWVAHRIGELYNIYGGIIPNIAIFVQSDSEIQKVASALNETAVLEQNHIKAKPCIGEGEIGSAEFVRVFNINLIKGMEFEAVFFMDVDQYNEAEMAMLDKLIYVGVSRATYYLAITLNATYPERLLPIQDLLKESDWNRDAYSDY
ncbi:MAG: hypothetical protein EOP48_06410, partial [Sphingobacteriales bacterium]